MLCCFCTLVGPNLTELKNCMPINPLSSVFDYVGMILISGIARNLTMETILTKFWGAGAIKTEGITGIFVTRGHGKATQPSNRIQTEDVLYIAGRELVRGDINPAAHCFLMLRNQTTACI